MPATAETTTPPVDIEALAAACQALLAKLYEGEPASAPVPA